MRPSSQRERVIDVGPEVVEGIDVAVGKVHDFCVKIQENTNIESDVNLVLAQLGGNSDRSIGRFSFAPGDEPQLVAQMIVDAAVQDGQDTLSGKRKYVVTMEEHRGRVSFALEFAEEDGYDPEEDETPNQQGVLAQSMGHAAKLMNMVRDIFDTSYGITRAQVAELMKENQSLRAGQLQGIQTMAEIYDAKHLRDIEMKKTLAHEERKDKIMGVLEASIPAVAQKLLGPKAPAGDSPFETMTLGFLKSMNVEQLQAFVHNPAWTEEQRIQLLHLIQAAQDKVGAKASPPAAETPSQQPPTHPPGNSGAPA